MRFEMPQRPNGNADPYLDKLWRWAYQATEQLNLVLDQLERAEALQGDAGSGTTLGTLAKQAEKNGSGVDSAISAIRGLRQEQEALSAALGGLYIQTGTASIAYGTGAKTAQVTFGKAYTQIPQVFAMQVFDTVPLTVHTTDITQQGFTARIAGGFPESGTRRFGWIAIGA